MGQGACVRRQRLACSDVTGFAKIDTRAVRGSQRSKPLENLPCSLTPIPTPNQPPPNSTSCKHFVESWVERFFAQLHEMAYASRLSHTNHHQINLPQHGLSNLPQNGLCCVLFAQNPQLTAQESPNDGQSPSPIVCLTVRGAYVNSFARPFLPIDRAQNAQHTTEGKQAQTQPSQNTAHKIHRKRQVRGSPTNTEKTTPLAPHPNHG